MQEIEIEIVVDRETEAVYRFTEFPVLIGRNNDCHLSICHETIPRNLCRVWLEKNGLIHIEEHPGLTNPLLESGKPVQNGVVKPTLSARVGPVGFEIRNTANKPKDSTLNFPKRTLFIAVSGALLILLLASAMIFTGHTAYDNGQVVGFPKALPLPVDAIQESSDVPADILLQLAQTEYMRLPTDVTRQMNAVAMMRTAAKRSMPKSTLTEKTRVLASQWEHALNAAYRLEVVTFQNALAKGDVTTARESAQMLLKYLAHAEAPMIEWLGELLRKELKQ